MLIWSKAESLVNLRMIVETLSGLAGWDADALVYCANPWTAILLASASGEAMASLTATGKSETFDLNLFTTPQ